MAISRRFFHPKSPRSREFQLAKMMMVLVLVFLILNTPRLLLGLLEVTQLSKVEHCYQHDQDFHIRKETFLLDFIARFLVIINSSINFLSYCLAGSEFRKQLQSFFVGKMTSTNTGNEEVSVMTNGTLLSRKAR